MTSNARNERREEQLFNDIWNSFSSTYMTLVSILQSVVLGYWAVQLENLPFDLLYSSSPDIRVLGDLLCFTSMFVFVIAFWNAYRMGSTIFFWIPTLIDSVIPFSIFAVQIYLIYIISSDNEFLWFGGMVILCVFAIFGYQNMFTRASANMLNETVLGLVSKYIKLNPAIAKAYLVFFTVYGLLNFLVDNEFLYLLFCVLTLLKFGYFLYSQINYWAIIVDYTKEQIFKKIYEDQLSEAFHSP